MIAVSKNQIYCSIFLGLNGPLERAVIDSLITWDCCEV